ncbi:MAG: hypothetical protein HON90_17940 [Halobacteriovoraceae bacterium]|jgi:hypothetical protein|nr:hypothetical protein [Halobacteriovoraceae bacterium]
MFKFNRYYVGFIIFFIGSIITTHIYKKPILNDRKPANTVSFDKHPEKFNTYIAKSNGERIDVYIDNARNLAMLGIDTKGFNGKESLFQPSEWNDWYETLPAEHQKMLKNNLIQKLSFVTDIPFSKIDTSMINDRKKFFSKDGPNISSLEKDNYEVFKRWYNSLTVDDQKVYKNLFDQNKANSHFVKCQPWQPEYGKQKFLTQFNIDSDSYKVIGSLNGEKTSDIQLKNSKVPLRITIKGFYINSNDNKETCMLEVTGEHNNEEHTKIQIEVHGRGYHGGDDLHGAIYKIKNGIPELRDPNMRCQLGKALIESIGYKEGKCTYTHIPPEKKTNNKNLKRNAN